ncbi:hypothetical protein CDL15_Pgr023369 [Punica granatum]|uniref:1,3-beta-glucan synthase n=2 Tax=Punica granatum TaxID=22663 RepID=A0A218Y2D6_PUNGR|nr:hypothetical protein CDL15_Pgr023369 [Punica granatum]
MNGCRHRSLPEQEVDNLVPPLDVGAAGVDSQLFPSVQAAVTDLRRLAMVLCNLPSASAMLWQPHHDLLDWLGLIFGFQGDNVRNQRDHLILHLANLHMRLPNSSACALDLKAIRGYREKLLENYEEWCSYLSVRSSVTVSGNPDDNDQIMWRELLYVSLYLLIWGEAANLRFLPECLCYIFHHMAMELNRILEGCLDNDTMPAYSGENSFLNRVVKPIYNTIRSEAKSSLNGFAPYSKWRNYEDFNEYFWSRGCFEGLKWPLNLESKFFEGAGKTGFVERRSFWNVFRSFHRLWLMLILFFQGAIILAWEEDNRRPWQALSNRNVKVRFLSVLVTWSGIEFLKSMLDILTQYSLVRRETLSLGVRMLVNSLISGSWAFTLGWLYIQIWSKKREDGSWFPEADRREKEFLKAACPFLLLKLLAFSLSFMPRISNFLIKKCRIYGLLTNRSYVGRGLREGLFGYAKYSVFWVIILSAKFSFSYFLQIQPMIKPTKELWNLNVVSYRLPEVFTDRSVLIIGLLWFPVVLIYLMDLQIWYTISTFMVGVAVGIFSRLGVIQNIGQLRCRFDEFAWEVMHKFNFMPKESMPHEMENHQRFIMRNKVTSEIMKLKSDHVMVRKFSLLWNEIVGAFREEDVISDYEVELLMFPLNYWNVSVITWPCFLLRDNLIRALSETQNIADAPDKWVCYKIFKEELTRCAVVEAYDSIKHLLLEKIIDSRTEEHSIVTACFQEVDESLEVGRFTKRFNMMKLPLIHVALIEFVESLTKAERDLDKVVNSLQTLYVIYVQEFIQERRSIRQLSEDGLAPRHAPSDCSVLFGNAVELPGAGDTAFAQQIRRLQIILTSRDSMENIPVNDEIRRRIVFFCNSLFMGIPKAPSVEKMKAFSVLTPYYDEDVLYSKEELKTNNEDGINVLYYLQTVYDEDWKKFMERMRREGMENESEIWTTKLIDLRHWASYRGQTLARTVRGMMYYGRAIKFLSFLESLSEIGSSEGSEEPVASSYSVKGHHPDISTMKFTYLVTCQNYGDQKVRNDPRAEEILYLMKKYEALRVAYVDEVLKGNDEYEYYSVLSRYDPALQKEVEVYRIKLPGPFKLGEGKPENQNHAIIFTRGDAVQTIDMNQESYFEEALKMGNLLEEFDTHYGIRKPTILGLREHIFTASVSSLAWLMSAQETGFVTSGQRVLANPLKVRMHYGHPDVFDRIWFLTRGGVSKASRVINICEDIFAGFNCTVRGGNVTHHEYMRIGKGRDVGLNQISMFEAKIASGSAEQLLSRDVYRLGHKLDFFRMLSFYHSTVGFYFNNIMVIWTMYVLFWGKLYMALSGAEDFQMGLDRDALRAILVIQLVQLVLFTGLPMIVDGSVEYGIYSAIWDFMISQLQLSSVFYTFSMGTRAHFFGRTILHGGAKYRGTGRGFVVMRESFASIYRLYARSHFVKAIELALVLTMYSLYSPLANGTFAFIDTSISGWFLVFSWMLSPFIFNPSGFTWFKTVDDLDQFKRWIWYPGGMFGKEEDSWERWWYQEQDHLRTTGFWGKLLEIILGLRFFFFQYGIVYQLRIASGRTNFYVYLLSWVYVAVPFAAHIMISHAHRKYAAKRHIYYRFLNSLGILVLLLVITALFLLTSFTIGDLVVGLVAAVPTGWGLVSVAQVLSPLLQRTLLWSTVVSVARLYDLLLGLIVMAPVAILSWLPGVQSMQTRVLFNAAFCRGLQVRQMLAGIMLKPIS